MVFSDVGRTTQTDSRRPLSTYDDMKPPEQLSDWRMEALMKGNEIRSARARDKEKIRWGALSPTEILRRPSKHWEKATVLELLTSIHRVGKRRARKWLMVERVDPAAEIGSLTELQRYRLARHVDEAARRAQVESV
jgi:hypothetical protein